ncbi:MAG: hypothetical protein PHW04_06915 [Candidatus Wallbacteria bacterium]|nr:hypothetical protein [Candidatus Wallbacteria bacterium]
MKRNVTREIITGILMAMLIVLQYGAVCAGETQVGSGLNSDHSAYCVVDPSEANVYIDPAAATGARESAAVGKLPQGIRCQVVAEEDEALQVVCETGEKFWINVHDVKQAKSEPAAVSTGESTVKYSVFWDVTVTVRPESTTNNQTINKEYRWLIGKCETVDEGIKLSEKLMGITSEENKKIFEEIRKKVCQDLNQEIAENQMEIYVHFAAEKDIVQVNDPSLKGDSHPRFKVYWDVKVTVRPEGQTSSQTINKDYRWLIGKCETADEGNKLSEKLMNITSEENKKIYEEIRKKVCLDLNQEIAENQLETFCHFSPEKDIVECRN